MKRETYISILMLTPWLFLASCSGNGELSDAYGNFEADEVVVSAETSGKVLQVLVKEGQEISVNELLAIVDTTDLILKMDQLTAQRSAIKAQLGSLDAQAAVFKQQKHNLEKDLVRVKAMREDGAATQKQLDDVQGGIALAEKQVASVVAQRAGVIGQLDGFDAQMDQIREMLSRSEVRSPIKGTVLNAFIEAGELAATGKALFKLAKLQRMKLRVFVSGDQLAGLKLGQEVEVLVDKDKKENRKLLGSLSWISQEAEFTPKIIQTKEERVNMVYAIEIIVINDGTLKIGMPGEVNFTSSD
jgi:HlyD family secretion protein